MADWRSLNERDLAFAIERRPGGFGYRLPRAARKRQEEQPVTTERHQEQLASLRLDRPERVEVKHRITSAVVAVASAGVGGFVGYLLGSQ